jgi:hypothetical protein
MQYGRWNREQDQHIALELVKTKRVRPSLRAVKKEKLRGGVQAASRSGGHLSRRLATKSPTGSIFSNSIRSAALGQQGAEA